MKRKIKIDGLEYPVRVAYTKVEVPEDRYRAWYFELEVGGGFLGCLGVNDHYNTREDARQAAIEAVECGYRLVAGLGYCSCR